VTRGLERDFKDAAEPDHRRRTSVGCRARLCVRTEGQVNPAQEPVGGEYVLKAETPLVVLDVVTYKKGAPVHGLKPSDFHHPRKRQENDVAELRGIPRRSGSPFSAAGGQAERRLWVQSYQARSFDGELGSHFHGPISRRRFEVVESTCLFLPRVIGLPRTLSRSASRVSPSKRFHDGSPFRDCSLFVMFRPSGLLASPIIPTAADHHRRAAKAFTSVLEHASLPPHASDMVTTSPGNCWSGDFHATRFTAWFQC